MGFAYRVPPAEDLHADSGWRFMSGFESQEYLDDASNSGVYDVNTIANYDPEIVSFLDAPVGSAFERRGPARSFDKVDDLSPPGDMA